MDSSANYLGQANKDNTDAQKSKVVEANDEEIVVFANGKNASNDTKKAPGSAQDAHDQSGADNIAPNGKGAPTGDADSLTDAFKSLNVNGKPAGSDPKYDYGLDSYRAPNKFPSIAVSSTPGDSTASADWHQQPNKVGRKAGEDAYGNGPSLYRPLNASASDFQHRGVPGAAGGYPAYGAPGGAYGTFQPPPMHGGYLPHGYDAFGLSPTLTEPATAGGANGAGGASGNNSGGRFVPRGPGAGGDHNGVGLTLNGLSGSASAQGPYSPIPLSPSPLSLNPYAAHHAAQMHMNGHQYGAYLPTAGGPGGASGGPGTKGEVPGSGLGTSPGSAGQNGNGPANGGNNPNPNAARGYPGPMVNVQGLQYSMPAQPQYYEDPSMYAQYGAPHLSHGAHGLHPNPAVHPQYGMNVGAHPGTPQMGAYGAYMHGPMVGVPGGAPGMLPVPNGVVNGHGGPNGAGQGGQGQGQVNQNGGLGHQGGGGANAGAAGGVAAGLNGPQASGVVTIVNGLTLLNGVPQPNADGTGPSANNRKLGLYKTELCRSWEEKGSCRYGPKCQFAHGEDEIRKVARHPKYKTEICRTFWLSGSCPYGKRCCFIHTDAPANSTNPPGAQGPEPGSASGPSTATAGGAIQGGENNSQGTTPANHTRSQSTASEVNGEAQPSSMLARINAKRGEGELTSPSGPPRAGTGRPDFAHGRHLSTDAAGAAADTSYGPVPGRPGHAHSASAHTLVSTTFTPPNAYNGGSPASGSTPGGATPVDGNGNLTPGSYWGHKRSASGSSATTATQAVGAGADAQNMRSIYATLAPSAA